MKLDVSDKTGSYGKKPHIKKGYYPAKLISVEERKNSKGEVHDGKYGQQLIMMFLVYNADQDGNATTVKKVISKLENGPEIEQELKLPKFVYHRYKDEKTGQLKTAITPNSALTKILASLGWKFDATKQVDIDSFIGKFVELNIDDFQVKDEVEGTYIASTIKDIGEYTGAPIEGKDTSTKETVSSEKLEVDVVDATETQPKPIEVYSDSELPEDVKTKIAGLKESLDQGLISQEGFDRAVSNLKIKK